MASNGKMDKMMKECMKPHALMHSVTGFAVALLVVAFVPSVTMYALTLGLVLLVVGIVGDYMVQSK